VLREPSSQEPLLNLRVFHPQPTSFESGNIVVEVVFTVGIGYISQQPQQFIAAFEDTMFLFPGPTNPTLFSMEVAYVDCATCEFNVKREANIKANKKSMLPGEI